MAGIYTGVCYYYNVYGGGRTLESRNSEYYCNKYLGLKKSVLEFNRGLAPAVLRL